MGLVAATAASGFTLLGLAPLADSAQRSAPATARTSMRKKNCDKPSTQDGEAATPTALHLPDSTSGSCTLFVVILVSYVLMNLGLGVTFVAMTGSLWASTVISLTNAVTAVVLLIFLRLRFRTSFVLFLWTSHLYLFASRLTVCEPTLGVDKWFLVVPMQAFFIAGVQGGSVTLFIGTLLHMLLPVWGHLVHDALYCTAFPAQSLPSLRMIGTFQFALYVGISCVGYELSRSSALRQMQRALAEKEATNEQLIQVSKAKERFIANTSHASCSRARGCSRSVRDAVGLILDCAQHLNTLITDLLSFQTLISAKPDLAYAAFSLTDEIERAWGQAVAAARRKGVHMTSDVRLQHWRRWGNAQGVRQILQCLLSNAVKFTPAGGQVELVARELNSVAEPQEELLSPDLADAVSEMVEFRVIDTGIGIDPENRAHLFSGFTQLDDSLRREYGGNGLGLAISQRLVEVMGGSITCSSEPNRGSTFAVALPLPLAPNDDHQPTTASRARDIPQTGGGEASPALGVAPLLPHAEEERRRDEPEGEEQRPRRGEEANKIRVLLVEDNTVNQKVGVRMLKSLGCDVDVAVNGLEAVAAVERALGFSGGEGGEGHDDHTAGGTTTGGEGHRHHYDLILMDCQMPVMDGFKATKRIRELERRGIAEEEAGRRKAVVRVPIVAVTASTTRKYEDKSYACDMDDFVAKVS